MSENRYWKGAEELDSTLQKADRSESEASVALPIDRRGFLKASGFTVAGTLLVGCSRKPVEKAIPYLVQPEEIVPGRAIWYASTCGGCTAGW